MTAPETDVRVPGYCAFCGDFHLVIPLPGHSGGMCGNCEQAGRADLPPGPDRPRYAPRITWWQQRRLQRTAEEFWDYGTDDQPRFPFGEFFTSRHWLRRLLWMIQGKG